MRSNNISSLSGVLYIDRDTSTVYNYVSAIFSTALAPAVFQLSILIQNDAFAIFGECVSFRLQGPYNFPFF